MHNSRATNLSFLQPKPVTNCFEMSIMEMSTFILSIKCISLYSLMLITNQPVFYVGLINPTPKMSHFYLVCRQCCLSISSQLQCKNMRLCHRIHWDTDHLEASVVTDLSLKTLIPQRTSEQIMSNTLQGVTYRHCGNDVSGWDFSLMCPPAIVKPPCSISFSSLKYKYWHVYQIHMISGFHQDETGHHSNDYS